MTKLGFGAVITAGVGLAALWYISRQTTANKQTSKRTLDDTDVDSGLPGKLATLVVGGTFSEHYLGNKASKQEKKMTKQQVMELAKLKLKKKPVTVKEAKELLETVSTPPIPVFFENFNINDDEFLDNVPTEYQQEILLQQMAAIEKACAAYNH